MNELNVELKSFEKKKKEKATIIIDFDDENFSIQFLIRSLINIQVLNNIRHPVYRVVESSNISIHSIAITIASRSNAFI